MSQNLAVQSTAPINQLRTWIAEQGLDAFIVSQPHNRSYLTGWFNEDTEGSGYALVDQQAQIVLTNTLYKEVAEREAAGWQVLIPEGEKREYAVTFATLAQKHGWKKIGFESKHITYWEYEKLSSAADGAYTLQSFEESAVSELRQVKQDNELELLKRAIAITDETFKHLCEWIQPGMTEKEVQWEILRHMVSLGADEQAFESIVASGPNASMPHAHASERRIQRGEFITIDMGARYKGYCADMTRTICLGEVASPRMRELYDAVLKAMKTCEAGLHAGITGRDGDTLARNVLEQAGLAEYYVHGTGHGVGLQVHEGPGMSPRVPEDMVLPLGSVVTVEPGVYIPGWSGVRVEDCVLIKENGCEVLTQSPTELVISR
jgi:Xaa-Pro aminopeptidase